MSKEPDKKNIIGFFASFTVNDSSKETFLPYLWGDGGLDALLGRLKWSSYGKDLRLILFQFHVRPIPYERDRLKQIETFRPKEKTIGIPVIVDDSNFFDVSEKERQEFLTQTVLQRLTLVHKVVRRNKLECDVLKLTNDVEKIFEGRRHAT